MVKKLNLIIFRERGKELKVPHHTNTTTVCNGNLPQLALNNSHLPLFPILIIVVINLVRSCLFILFIYLAQLLSIKVLYTSPCNKLAFNNVGSHR